MFQFKLIGNNPLGAISRHLCKLPTFAGYATDDVLINDWTLKRFKFESASGYFSDLSDYGVGVALLRGNTTWMTLTPLEAESQLIAQYSASGKVVIAGLGLGLILHSILAKKNVSQIVVLEVDKDLIDNYPTLLSAKTRKEYDRALNSGRLKILHCDCKEPLPEHVLRQLHNVEYLWVDIWDDVNNQEALTDTLVIQKQVKAKRCDYWCCEIDLVMSCSRTGIFNITTLCESARQSGLPLSVLSMSGHALQLYAEICLKATSLIHSRNAKPNFKLNY
ncbi:hypothetical protein [Vibrio harveyi]|uniref:hypothetical protein n=1 Tax=Vibrio harveyi TaxID=669 RepID=UPI0024809284|nr:hypothetical protein [Vibrio harveyi]